MATLEEEAGVGSDGSIPPGGGTRIRPARSADVEQIGVIESASFSNPWHPQTFGSLIEQGRALVLVAENGASGVVGYAVLWWVLEQGELANLAVKEGFRGRGVGSALLAAVVERAGGEGVESLFLEVRASNDPARELYLSRGFAQVALRKDYYRNPREDAQILMKRL